MHVINVNFSGACHVSNLLFLTAPRFICISTGTSPDYSRTSKGNGQTVDFQAFDLYRVKEAASSKTGTAKAI